ncbi:MAG: hypothetical protein WC992_07605 [Acholeplasmataceae bacterium]|jgi:hypothetical protein
MIKDLIKDLRFLGCAAAVILVILTWPADKSLLDLVGPFIMLGVMGGIFQLIRHGVRRLRARLHPTTPEAP